MAPMCMQGGLALLYAASHDHTEIVKVLLAAGANVYAWNDAALRWAASNGHSETVTVLLMAGADVHAEDDKALCLAVMTGHTETLLLAAHITTFPESNYMYMHLFGV